MHESSLARQILRVVLKTSDGQRVVRVRGWLSESEALSAESLQLHFTAQAQGTPAADATLDLRLTHLQARCSGCGAVYLPDHHLTLCPECGSIEGTLLGEPGLGIEAIEVDDRSGSSDRSPPSPPTSGGVPPTPPSSVVAKVGKSHPEFSSQTAAIDGEVSGIPPFTGGMRGDRTVQPEDEPEHHH